MGFFLYSFSCIPTFLMDILPQIATSASLTSHFVPHETHTHSHSFYNCIHKVLTHKQLILTIYLLIFHLSAFFSLGLSLSIFSGLFHFLSLWHSTCLVRYCALHTVYPNRQFTLAISVVRCAGQCVASI